MIYSDIDVTHALRLYNKCPLDCYYCDLCNDDVKKDEIIHKIKNIRNTNIFIYGGEFVNADSEFICNVLTTLKQNGCKMIADTSGVIFNHPEYFKYFEYINYHCTIDLDNRVHKINMNNIIYEVVLTDKNIHNLKNFLKANSDIDFFLVDNGINYINTLKAHAVIKRYGLSLNKFTLIEI